MMQEIEPTLLKFAQQAGEAERTIQEAPGQLNLLDPEIGGIDDPDRLRSIISGIREVNRPLLEKVKGAEEAYDGVAILVADLINTKDVLDQIQAGHARYSGVITEIEEGVKEGTLAEDYRSLPNVCHFQERADFFGLILKLHERGSELGVAVPGPELPPEGSEITPEDFERQELLNMVTIRDGGEYISRGENTIHFTGRISQETIKVLFDDLTTGWGRSLGVPYDKVAEIAKRHGYQGERPGSKSIRNLQEAFRDHGWPIFIKSIPDPENNRSLCYRIRKRVVPETGPLGDTEKKDGPVDGSLAVPRSRQVFS